MVIPALTAAVQGIEQNRERFAAQAEKISRTGFDDAPAEDLAGSLVDLKTARRGMEANLAVLRAADEMLGTLIDVLA